MMSAYMSARDTFKVIASVDDAMERAVRDLDRALTWGNLSTVQRDDLTRAHNLVSLAIDRLNGNRHPLMASAL